MKTQFRCPSCGKRMSADSRFAGRTVPCPICGAQILIPSCAPAPNSAAASTRDVGDDFDLADDFELLSSESGASAQEATGTITSTGNAASTATSTATTTATAFRAPNERVAGHYYVSPPFEFPTLAPDPNDPMTIVYPCYEPNPFALSYPLDQAAANASEPDEDDDSDGGFASKMPSVDELIN